MKTETTILYVEDDPSLAFITKYNLENTGYTVMHCMDGSEALATFKVNEVHLCILDVMLPGMEGFSLASHIRAMNKDVPILFLSVKSLLEDKICGLQLGADDYICKPFHLEELLLKIKIFLKRQKISVQHDKIAMIGAYAFDYLNLTLAIGAEAYQLTLKEAQLLRYLYERKNTVVKREDILKTVWGDDDYFLGRSMDVFISRLRKYLSRERCVKIENVHSVGFKMSIGA